MMRLGIDGEGLWTLSRGLARSKAEYLRKLAHADRPRQGSLDDRGNLSDKALGEFTLFILEQTLGQLDFMLSLLSPLDLIERIERYLIYERTDLSTKRRAQYTLLLKTLLIEGSLPRGKVAPLLGLKESAARDVIRSILKDKLVSSPSPKGALEISFPAEVIESYFPKLYLDLPV